MSDKLISADRLKKEVQDCIDEVRADKRAPEWFRKTTVRFLEAVKEQIDVDPAVDAVEVIRCRDCKYYHQRRETFGDCRQGDDWREVYPDDFCSYGERKERE